MDIIIKKYNKRPDLRRVMDFVIVNSEQHSEFDAFKRAMTDRDYILLSSNVLPLITGTSKEVYLNQQ